MRAIYLNHLILHVMAAVTVLAGWFKCVTSCLLAILILWGPKRVSVAVVVEVCHVFCRIYRFVLHLFPFVARQYRNNRRHALRAIVSNAVGENVHMKPDMEVCVFMRAFQRHTWM